MSKHVWNYIAHVRGAADTPEEARNIAKRRFAVLADTVAADNANEDPGADLRSFDPGGGGGPCEPNLRTQDFDVSDSGLPEAVSRDDDD